MNKDEQKVLGSILYASLNLSIFIEPDIGKSIFSDLYGFMYVITYIINILLASYLFNRYILNKDDKEEGLIKPFINYIMSIFNITQKDEITQPNNKKTKFDKKCEITIDLIKETLKNQSTREEVISGVIDINKEFKSLRKRLKILNISNSNVKSKTDINKLNRRMNELYRRIDYIATRVPELVYDGIMDKDKARELIDSILQTKKNLQKS